MLARLREAHRKLLEGIQELEEATKESAPDPSKLATIRWRLSRASGQRRRLVDEACAQLLENASPGAAQQMSTLRENSGEMLAATSKHVGHWTIEQVVADWEGYRTASAAMRTAMRARIAAEQAILYPLLGGAA